MDKDVLIQKYLQGTLSKSEELLFEEYRTNDPSFAKGIPFYEELQYAFAKADYEQTKSQLQSFYKEERRAVWKKWSIAATVLVLIGLGSMFYLNTLNSSEKLYAQYFEPYKNIVQPIVRGDAATTTKVRAFMAYDDGDYAQAIGYFDALLREEPIAIFALYKANAQLQINQTEAAINILTSDIKKTDSIYAEAQWYLALGYLKIEDQRAAKKSLNVLLESDSNFKNKEAQELLKLLESLE